MQRLPKRLHRPEWHGANWAMHFLDGNTDEWFLFFPDSKFVKARWSDEITRETAKEIADALREAAKFLEGEFPAGGGKVVKLERR